MKQRKSEINWKLVVRVACLMLLDVMLLYLACLLALLAQVVPTYHPEAGGRPAANVS